MYLRNIIGAARRGYLASEISYVNAPRSDYLHASATTRRDSNLNCATSGVLALRSNTLLQIRRATVSHVIAKATSIVTNVHCQTCTTCDLQFTHGERFELRIAVPVSHCSRKWKVLNYLYDNIA